MVTLALEWDSWPPGWVEEVARATDSLWCWGSTRLFLARAPEFWAAGYRLSQDVIWEKHNGTGFATDRFKRVHEIATHWYRGSWSDVHHVTPRESYAGAGKHDRASRQARTPHTGAIGAYHYEDDGTRLLRSILRVPSVRGGLSSTQKPVGVLTPLLRYSVPTDGTVLDPMAGSGSTGVAARLLGRRAVLVEADERYCEIAATRLDQGVLTLGEPA